jgi:hypothetical protein
MIPEDYLLHVLSTDFPTPQPEMVSRYSLREQIRTSRGEWRWCGHLLVSRYKIEGGRIVADLQNIGLIFLVNLQQSAGCSV